MLLKSVFVITKILEGKVSRNFKTKTLKKGKEKKKFHALVSNN